MGLCSVLTFALWISELFGSSIAATFISCEGECGLNGLQSLGSFASSMASLQDERNVTVYNDQPVQLSFLSMKDMVFSASDIHELKMVCAVYVPFFYHSSCCVVHLCLGKYIFNL